MRWSVYACVFVMACTSSADPADLGPQSSMAAPSAAASGPAGTATAASSSGQAASMAAASLGAANAGHSGTQAGAGDGASAAPSASASAGIGATAGTSAKPSAGAGGAAGTAAAADAQRASAAASAGIAGAAGDMNAGTTGGATPGAAAGASGTTAGMAGAADPDAAQVVGCEGSTLLAAPADTGARGPWPIGEKTLQFGRFSDVEVFYPAQPGSEQGKPEIEFDMRVFLPERERSKIPDAEATIVKAGTFRDLPLDTEHGPYPVIIFVHGTASFRLRSLSSETLWASRGFIVMAADHPNLYLADYLGSNGCGLNVPPLDLSGDVDSEIAALSSPQGELAFLDGHIDMQRLALAGHSAGAYNVAQFTSKPGVQMIVALAGTRAVSSSPALRSVLYVAGRDDAVLPYGPGGVGLGTILYPGSDTDAYNASPGPSMASKRLVGIANAGHLNVVDGCAKNAMNKTGIEVAQDHGVCGASNVAPLADCGSVDPELAISITNEVMTAALEETLQCQDRAAWISALPSRHAEVDDFHEAVP